MHVVGMAQTKPAYHLYAVATRKCVQYDTISLCLPTCTKESILSTFFGVRVSWAIGFFY